MSYKFTFHYIRPALKKKENANYTKAECDVNYLSDDTKPWVNECKNTTFSK